MSDFAMAVIVTLVIIAVLSVAMVRSVIRGRKVSERPAPYRASKELTAEEQKAVDDLHLFAKAFNEAWDQVEGHGLEVFTYVDSFVFRPGERRGVRVSVRIPEQRVNPSTTERT